MLERHSTAERINEIVNDPSVYSHVKGSHTHPFDLKNVASNHHNVCLVGQHGCVIFIKHQPGVYEFHTSVLPEGRGEWMVEGSRFAFSYMFTRTDAFELLTKCPDGNIPAKAGARAVGCPLRFRTRPLWPSNGILVPVDVHSVVLQEWAKNSTISAESGKWFHRELELEYIRLGKSLQVHEDDEIHDQYVGIAVEMIRNGQIRKAIDFYNRWAVMSSYKKIELISLNPIIIDIFESKVLIENDTFKVI